MDQQTKQEIIAAVKFRHKDGGIGGTNWTNQHGLDRCDCDDLIEFLEGL
jgi:hypothetical protein